MPLNHANVEAIPADPGGSPDARLRAWLIDVALPRWLEIAADPRGGFHETVTFEGAPGDADKRLRTMARQTWAFATAATFGWHAERSRALAEHGFAFLTGPAAGSGSAFAKTFHPDGRVKDATRDAYDHAFVLFASAACHRAGIDGARELGETVRAVLKRDFALGADRGYREIAGPDVVSSDLTTGDAERRANPHMHLLEAFTAWHRATGCAASLADAHALADLFEAHFYDPATWSVREHVDADLNPLHGARGDIREPGHAAEWAWLLHDLDPDNAARRDIGIRLITMARRIGLNPHTGLPRHEITAAGVPLQGHSRIWSQTEMIRALCMLIWSSVDAGEVSAATQEAHAAVNLLFSHYIDPAPAGLWIDTLAPDGSAVSQTVPASILYHLMTPVVAYTR